MSHSASCELFEAMLRHRRSNASDYIDRPGKAGRNRADADVGIRPISDFEKAG